ncbi:ADP-ribose pyrophosphatase YjhB, NUDIX family [Paenibacillus sp. 1_12]|uniref:NUDIX hydrolase n=1 Tax=Paenibacillus sp. 1_12 TaxID=1566278 RepID=UPI0008E56D18|nr:NUDIX hydrolase [Paenibacillus sp. 1_12]SFL63993.1 ADP-ribose pyrophosphatase YjhB, NUDIX family [Paenibacillus sp. 1_12]
MSLQWLDWAKRIQFLSQAGLTFSKDPFDLERFTELRNISAEIMQAYTGLHMEKINDLFTNETGFQTPKADVRGVVFKDEQILMVKESNNDRWSLPGGFCDIGLSPSENVIKEIKEESGYEVKTTKLLAIFDSTKHPHPPQPYHYYKIFIRCEIVGGAPTTGIETTGIDFFPKNQLPNLSTDRNTESQIKLMFEFLTNPNLLAILE